MPQVGACDREIPGAWPTRIPPRCDDDTPRTRHMTHCHDSRVERVADLEIKHLWARPSWRRSLHPTRCRHGFDPPRSARAVRVRVSAVASRLTPRFGVFARCSQVSLDQLGCFGSSIGRAFPFRRLAVCFPRTLVRSRRLAYASHAYAHGHGSFDNRPLALDLAALRSTRPGAPPTHNPR